MTEPCIDPDSFDVTDGVVGPHPWLQWRHVATDTAAGAVTTLTDTAEVLVHDLQLSWTNTTPIPQHAYGLCTRDATDIAVTSNRRFYLEQRRGWTYGTAPAVPGTANGTSRHGGGMDRGTATVSSTLVSIFGVWQRRQGSATTPIGPDVILAPGQMLRLRIALYVVRETWAPAVVSTYASEVEMLIDSGATQLDIFAYPALT